MKCVVLYNGKKDDPDEWKLDLSDLFAIRKSELLKEYAEVIHRTDQCVRQSGNKEKRAELIRKMIHEQPESFEIKPLLKREKDEVARMLLTESDAKERDRHTYNDGKEDGLAEELNEV